MTRSFVIKSTLDGEGFMNSDIKTVLDAALKLPPDELEELKRRLNRITISGRKRTGDVTRFFGTFDSGDPRSADNDKIDAALAEEYDDDHAPEK
jgi:hypothetical protein